MERSARFPSPGRIGGEPVGAGTFTGISTVSMSDVALDMAPAATAEVPLATAEVAVSPLEALAMGAVVAVVSVAVGAACASYDNV